MEEKSKIRKKHNNTAAINQARRVKLWGCKDFWCPYSDHPYFQNQPSFYTQLVNRRVFLSCTNVMLQHGFKCLTIVFANVSTELKYSFGESDLIKR